jgi:hypothetical protein
VNNAGIGVAKRPEEHSTDDWRKTLDTNLSSAFWLSQAAYPQLKRAGRGKIINIGSMMSIFGAPCAAAYAASKGGLVQLTKALATAWAAENIQVNAVLPGWIDTDLTRMPRDHVDGLNEQVLARTPAGRWGVPEDLAGVAVFLASRAPDFVTGAAIPVDGGFAVQGLSRTIPRSPASAEIARCQPPPLTPQSITLSSTRCDRQALHRRVTRSPPHWRSRSTKSNRLYSASQQATASSYTRMFVSPG